MRSPTSRLLALTLALTPALLASCGDKDSDPGEVITDTGEPDGGSGGEGTGGSETGGADDGSEGGTEDGSGDGSDDTGGDDTGEPDPDPDSDGDGHPASTDCDDTDAEVFPGALEVCNAIDDDCDGDTDEGLPSVPTDHATIQDAIDALPDGSEICLEAGTFTEPFEISGRTLSIVGAGGSELVSLDLSHGSFPHITDTLSTTSVVLQGFTVTGLDADTAGYVGFLLEGRGELTLRDVAFREVVIRAGDAEGFVGPLMASKGTLTLEDLVISEVDIAYTPTDGGTLIHKGGFLYSTGELTIDGLTIEDVDITTSGTVRQVAIEGMFLRQDGDPAHISNLVIRDVSAEIAHRSASNASGLLAYFEDSDISIAGLTVQDVEVHIDGRDGINTYGLLAFADSTVELSELELHDSRLSCAEDTSDDEDLTEGCRARGLVHIDESELTLSHVSATGNQLSAAGSNPEGGEATGGVFYLSESNLDASHVDLRDNTLEGGDVAYGGGIWFYHLASGSLRLHNAIFAGNALSSQDQAAGGGLYTSCGGCTLDVANVDVVGNTVTGGSVFGGGWGNLVAGDNGTVVNVNLSANSLTGGTVATGEQLSWAAAGSSGIDWSYNNVDDSSSAPYGSGQDLTGTSGNIGTSPDHTDISGSDPATWDLSLASGSALIDAGDPSLSDADGSTSDMGAYGGPEGASW